METLVEKKQMPIETWVKIQPSPEVWNRISSSLSLPEPIRRDGHLTLRADGPITDSVAGWYQIFGTETISSGKAYFFKSRRYELPNHPDRLVHDVHHRVFAMQGLKIDEVIAALSLIEAGL